MFPWLAWRRQLGLVAPRQDRILIGNHQHLLRAIDQTKRQRRSHHNRVQNCQGLARGL
jgi:hypothetical protein